MKTLRGPGCPSTPKPVPSVAVMRVTFTVPGPPQPKERARRGRTRAGKVIWYTPTRTVKYEQHVAECAQVAFAKLRKPWIATDKSARYRLEVHCYFPDARHRDGDNVLKGVSDALNELAWPDDSQVMVCTAIRDIDRVNPRAVVTIEVISCQA